MKIVISTGTLARGGAERVISILANSLSNRGHDVELLLYYDLPICYDVSPNVKITVSEKEINSSNKIKQLLWRRKYIKKSGADIVVSFLAPFNMFNIVSMVGVNIPLIVADRNDPRCIPRNPVMRKLRDFLYCYADGVVLQSCNNRNYFCGKVQRKSRVIFNPVDVGDYEKKALAFKEKKKEIVSVGRIIKQKNPAMLLEAFSNLSADFPEYKLRFVGEGDLIDELKTLAIKKGIADRVELPGPTKNVFESICYSKMFVMTSEYEGMPNALLEAMCIGLPVISTKVSGAVDVIEDGANGLLVDCRDTQSLEFAIRRYLSDQALCESCGENATRLAESLRVDAITSQWESFIKEIIDCYDK